MLKVDDVGLIKEHAFKLLDRSFAVHHEKNCFNFYLKGTNEFAQPDKLLELLRLSFGLPEPIIKRYIEEWAANYGYIMKVSDWLLSFRTLKVSDLISVQPMMFEPTSLKYLIEKNH